MPPWEWPTRSTLAAPVSASTSLTNDDRVAADAAMSPVPWIGEVGEAPP